MTTRRWLLTLALLALGCAQPPPPAAPGTEAPAAATPLAVESQPATREPAPEPLAPLHQQVAFNFDLDDNILDLPTKIYLYHRQTGEVAEVGTGEVPQQVPPRWGHCRDQAGDRLQRLEPEWTSAAS